MAEYRARRRSADLPAVDKLCLADLRRRVANLEHYFAQLSTLQRAAWNRGYLTGRRLHRKSQERASYFNALPKISLQEAARISHEFGR
jgi:hypothetical protein